MYYSPGSCLKYLSLGNGCEFTVYLGHLLLDKDWNKAKKCARDHILLQRFTYETIWISQLVWALFRLLSWLFMWSRVVEQIVDNVKNLTEVLLNSTFGY